MSFETGRGLPEFTRSTLPDARSFLHQQIVVIESNGTRGVWFSDGVLWASSVARTVGATVSASRALTFNDFGKTTPVDTSGGAVVLTHNTGTVNATMQPARFQRRGANALTVVAGTGAVSNPDTVTVANGAFIDVTPDPLTADAVVLE